MAPPTNAELAARERMIRRAVARMDPDGLTPPLLREAIIDAGARFPETGGALLQAAIDAPVRGPRIVREQGSSGQQ
ncbi:hypothetical protein E0Z10_g9310 [Xylaria hypoxylon]|uniref:Uncharacterized protein n=1 Tax=Xylaria hypoxylon TaxID=37992 RepID=A0A4Z0Y5Z1_9PEZI|nr:hypothetical protein E0Z10_g9310 [Xylaria hypoxylon]